MTPKADPSQSAITRALTGGKLACHAQAPNHADSAGCSACRRRLAGPRRCSRGRGHIGRKGISGGCCAGLRKNAGLACRRFWHSNHPANLRQAAKTHTHLARLRRNRDRAYPRVRLAMVSRWWTLRFERLCASSGISVPPAQVASSRSIGSNSQGSTFLNWSLCPTSAEEWLTPR